MELDRVHENKQEKREDDEHTWGSNRVHEGQWWLLSLSVNLLDIQTLAVK
jgi:hypothetical protein